MSTMFIAEMTECGIVLLLTAAVVVSTVKLVRAIKRHTSWKKPVIFHVVSMFVLCSAVLFAVSHGTYWKYNDWFVLGNHVNAVIERYGQFDRGSVKTGSAGRIGYYIGTDNGPVMPDYLPYYYDIYYNENGIVYQVKTAPKEGG